MDNAQELAAGPGGASLAAALASVGSPQHAARVALYALAAGPDAAWRLVPDVGARWLRWGSRRSAKGRC